MGAKTTRRKSRVRASPDPKRRRGCAEILSEESWLGREALQGIAVRLLYIECRVARLALELEALAKHLGAQKA